MKDELLPLEEIRRRFRRYRREPPKVVPPPGTGKSKVMAQFDILLLAGLHTDKTSFYRFMKGGHHHGISNKRMLKLQEILVLCDNHMITKSQVGVYHYHDEPVKPPVKEMKVNLMGKGGPGLLPGVKQVEAPKRMKMPGFDRVFGGGK